MKRSDEMQQGRDAGWLGDDRENANVDGKSPLAKLSRLGATVAKEEMLSLLSNRTKRAMQDNLLYIHDADYYVTGTTTCCQIPLGSLLRNGFHTGHGSIRPPQDIRSALALASIIVQANQNMQHGGQAFATFDHDLAPYVEKTYVRQRERLMRYDTTLSTEQINRLAEEETMEMTFQACEAFIHNANSMHSRGGDRFRSFRSITDGHLKMGSNVDSCAPASDGTGLRERGDGNFPDSNFQSETWGQFRGRRSESRLVSPRLPCDRKTTFPEFFHF